MFSYQNLIEISFTLAIPLIIFFIGKILKHSKKLRLGIFEFSIKLKGFAELEADNEALQRKNEELRLQASLVEAAWAKLAKEKLCEDCREGRETENGHQI
jgi:hypothetical protein